MAAAAFLNDKRGDALVRTAVTGSATVDIGFLPSNSDFRRVLKLSRGKSRRSAAIRSRGAIAASAFGALPSVRDNIASTALLSCSIFFVSLPPGFPGFRERLGIGTLHSSPQTGESAELQLLHRALGLANVPRYLLDTFLLHKPQHNHSPLLGGQRIH